MKMTNKKKLNDQQMINIKYFESDIPKEFFILTWQEQDPEDLLSSKITHLIIAYQPSKWTILRDDKDLICLINTPNINVSDLSIFSTVTVSKKDLMISEQWDSAMLYINPHDIKFICQQALPKLFANPNQVDQESNISSVSETGTHLPNYIVKTFPVWHYL